MASFRNGGSVLKGMPRAADANWLDIFLMRGSRENTRILVGYHSDFRWWLVSSRILPWKMSSVLVSDKKSLFRMTSLFLQLHLFLWKSQCANGANEVRRWPVRGWKRRKNLHHDLPRTIMRHAILLFPGIPAPISCSMASSWFVRSISMSWIWFLMSSVPLTRFNGSDGRHSSLQYWTRTWQFPLSSKNGQRSLQQGEIEDLLPILCSSSEPHDYILMFTT
jgi:hypothetical protein